MAHKEFRMGRVAASVEWPEGVPVPGFDVDFRPKNRGEFEDVVAALGGLTNAMDIVPGSMIASFISFPFDRENPYEHRVNVFLPDEVRNVEAKPVVEPGVMRLRGRQIVERTELLPDPGWLDGTSDDTFEFVGSLPEEVVESPHFKAAYEEVAVGHPITEERRAELIGVVRERDKIDSEARAV